MNFSLAFSMCKTTIHSFVSFVNIFLVVHPVSLRLKGPLWGALVPTLIEEPKAGHSSSFFSL
jgi:hypothetical protein